MRKFISCIVFIVFSTNSYCQTNIDKIVLEIREKYKKIVSEKESYFKNISKSGDISDSGGYYAINQNTTYSYYKSKKIEEYKHTTRKVNNKKVVKLNDDRFSSSDESSYIYYKNNKPIFKVNITEIYAHPPYNETTKTFYKNSKPFYNITYPSHELDTTPILDSEMLARRRANLDNKKNTLSPDTLNEINKIYNIYENIINHKKSLYKETVEYSNELYKLKNLDYEKEESDFRERLIYYDDIKLIVSVYNNVSNGNQHESGGTKEYYFNNGELFFCFVKEYVKEIAPHPHSDFNIITANEKRIYVHNNKPIRILVKKAEKKEKRVGWEKFNPDDIYKTISKLKNMPVEIIEANYMEVKKYIK